MVIALIVLGIYLVGAVVAVYLCREFGEPPAKGDLPNEEILKDFLLVLVTIFWPAVLGIGILAGLGWCIYKIFEPITRPRHRLKLEAREKTLKELAKTAKAEGLPDVAEVERRLKE